MTAAAPKGIPIRVVVNPPAEDAITKVSRWLDRQRITGQISAEGSSVVERLMDDLRDRPETRTQKANRFINDLKHVETDLRILADRIDELGEAGEMIGQVEGAPMCPDQIACYASNSLQGTLALLRDLRRAVKLPAGKRGRQ